MDGMPTTVAVAASDGALGVAACVSMCFHMWRRSSYSRLGGGGFCRKKKRDKRLE